MAVYTTIIPGSAPTTYLNESLIITTTDPSILQISDASSKALKTTFLSASLVVIITANIILNSAFVTGVLKSRDLRRTPLYFMVNVACVDIVGGTLWSVLTSITVLSSRWALGDELCSLQGVFCVFVFLTSVHNFVIMVGERAMETGLPDKHEEMFNRTTSLIIIFTLWAFDLLTAMLPFIGWGGYAFFSMQFQCGLHFENSIPQLYFILVIGYVVPEVGILMCFISHLHNLRQRRGSITPHQMLRNERQDSQIGENSEKGQEKTLNVESYGKKFRRQQTLFQNKFISNARSGSAVNGPDNNNLNHPVLLHDEEMQVNKRSASNGSRARDTVISATVLITVFFYMILWLPFIVLNYFDLHTTTVTVTESAWIAAVWSTHLSTAMKPVIYFAHNKHIRESIKRALCTKQRKRQNFSDKSSEKGEIIPTTVSISPKYVHSNKEIAMDVGDHNDRDDDSGSGCSSGSSTTAFNEPRVINPEHNK